jgi:CubicO group peptidase (beta-lactamase class C family)
MRSEQPIWRTHGVDERGTTILRQFLVERASGRTWWSYVQTRILARAGMTETEYDTPDHPGLRATAYYGTRPLSTRDATATADRSDGIRSTVVDFLRYSRALDDGRLLSEAALAEMEELVPGSFIKGFYGVWRYGWLVSRSFGHRFEGQHAHGEPGWSTSFARLPDDGITIVLFENRTNGNGQVIDGVIALLLGCAPDTPPRATASC